MSETNENSATISLSDATALTPFREVNYLYHETLVLLRAGRGTLFLNPSTTKVRPRVLPGKNHEFILPRTEQSECQHHHE